MKFLKRVFKHRLFEFGLLIWASLYFKIGIFCIQFVAVILRYRKQTMNTNATNESVLIALNKRTLLNVMYTHNVLAERFSEILKQYDLSSEQFNVLKILQYQKGKPVNMCDIQERMISKTSNTTRLVDKLLLKGYVTREVCRDNRRKIEVFITQPGLEILKDLKPKMYVYEEKLSGNLTITEFEDLNYLLEKYRTI